MLLRNINVTPGAFPGPGAVPSAVDDEALAACLRAGRPEGEPGLVTVHGVGCPTIAAGRGRPVLCVHGLGHDAWDWAPFFVRCKSQVSLLALDLPGFGLADQPALPESRAWDLQLLVDAVLAAAAQAPEPPVVVGSSLGGHVALLAALREPDAFARLVLAAPGGLVDAPAPVQAIARRYYTVEAICGRMESEIVGNSRRIFAKPGNPLDDELAARKLAVHRSARRREFAVPFAGYVDDVFHHVVLGRLHQIRPPTLILSGARDVVVPPDACAAAARHMGARFVSFSGVGHCPHLEAPDAFVDAVMPFILGGDR